MAEILGVAAGIAGLISLAQGLVVPLAKFIGSAKQYPEELKAVVGDIRSFCGVLCVVQPVIEQLERRGRPISETQAGFFPPSFRLTRMIRWCSDIARTNWGMQENFERVGVVVDQICPAPGSKGRGMSQSRQRRVEEGGHESALGAL